MFTGEEARKFFKEMDKLEIEDIEDIEIPRIDFPKRLSENVKSAVENHINFLEKKINSGIIYALQNILWEI